MKVLVTGGGGLLGQTLLRLATRAHWAINGLARAQLDISNRRAVASTLDSLKPDLLINAAAFTDVDGAETRADDAFRANAEGPRVLAEQCNAAGIALVHVSTDCVFGRQSPPYRAHQETDTPQPESVYGKSKLAGEEAVLDLMPRASVVRTSWVFGGGPQGFVAAVGRRALAGEAVRVVSDQRGCPTPMSALAEGLLDLGAAQVGGSSDTGGIFHFCGAGEIERLELARLIVAEASSLTGQAPVEVLPARSAELDVAIRPNVATLDCARMSRVLGRDMPDWRSELPAAVRRLAG